jgi:hypothetical protein
MLGQGSTGATMFLRIDEVYGHVRRGDDAIV